MPDRCPKCGIEVASDVYVCESCGAHIRAIRAEAKVKMLEEAIQGWRNSSRKKDAEIKQLREALEDIEFSDECAQLIARKALTGREEEK